MQQELYARVQEHPKFQELTRKRNRFSLVLSLVVLAVFYCFVMTVALSPDSLALPLAVVLRFRLVGERRVRGLCIPRDALTREAHRRLRVRLKFSRRRWAAPG